MKIKEVSAGVKISKNYNSYNLNLTADVENDEVPEKVGEVLMKKAEEILKNNLDFEEKNLVEVGAAWPHKKSTNFLSVKLDDGEYTDVKIQDLETTRDGYKSGELVYKKVKKRMNDKMPTYRIYKEVKDEKI